MNTLYAVARTVLLDALEALNEQRDAVVLVGAQAIYLHTGDADIAVPAFTTDGDLVIEPSRSKDEPRLAEAMARARFELSGPRARCRALIDRQRARQLRCLLLTEADTAAKIRPMNQTPDRHRRLRAVFDAALLYEPSAREAYVDRACASDSEVRPEVMRLLDSAAEAERIWALLSDGGQIFMPMQETFFAVRFGQLRDRFGTSWMILALKPQTA